MWKNVVNYIGCDAGYDEARVVLYGAPFDSTTSFRPGTRFAGQAVRNDSYGLETYSPYQDLELTEGTVYDCGDLELAIGDPGIVLEQIRETAEKILQDGKLPFMIGGVHLVTVGAVRASAHKYPDMHFIWELLGDGRIHQLGIRSGEKYEFDWAKSGHTDFHPFVLDDLEAVLESVGDAPVYFTVDLDVLDPSVFPGTGTPEPGGVDFLTLMRAVTNVCGRVNLIGCDVNELCPPCDPTGASTAVACKIIREMLTAIVNRENGQIG